jgi:hypothetical protein
MLFYTCQQIGKRDKIKHIKSLCDDLVKINALMNNTEKAKLSEYRVNNPTTASAASIKFLPLTWITHLPILKLNNIGLQSRDNDAAGKVS